MTSNSSTGTYLWQNTYINSHTIWLSDSLNCSNAGFSLPNDLPLLSYYVITSFNNWYTYLSNITKFSHFDALLIQLSFNSVEPKLLYIAFINDNFLQNITCFLPITFLFQYEYNDPLATTLIISQELTLLINEYIQLDELNTLVNPQVVQVFDTVLNNLSLVQGLVNLNIPLFFLFTYNIIYCFLQSPLSRWVGFKSFYHVRYYFYSYSVSTESRIQFEVLQQTIVFFIMYWAITLLTFDDDYEEVIEFTDTAFIWMFTVLIGYLGYRYSTHYFSFLSASVAEGRSVAFVVQQFKKDFLDTLSLILRFYILLFRMTVYDMLEDCFDGYYIFVGDLDDDEYFNELFIFFNSLFLFKIDNLDDRSFILEGENNFTYDLFYSYYVVWGKLFFFLFFMIEEGARLGLAFYITFLILYNIHSSAATYNDITYMAKKRCN